jgi:hypothetical protein
MASQPQPLPRAVSTFPLSFLQVGCEAASSLTGCSFRSCLSFLTD